MLGFSGSAYGTPPPVNYLFKLSINITYGDIIRKGLTSIWRISHILFFGAWYAFALSDVTGTI